VTTVSARRVASLPERSALATWDKIIDILAPDSSDPARVELTKVGGVAAMLIAAESPKDSPIVLYGGGVRARVYGVFGDDAIAREGLNEQSLGSSGTGEGWKLSLPCSLDDLTWVRRKLKSLSARVKARAGGEDVEDEEAPDKAAGGAAASVFVDRSEFLKP